MSLVTTGLIDIFDDTEELVAAAAREAEKLMESGRGEAQRLRREVTAVDKRISMLTDRLIDPSIDEKAKAALSRDLATRELTRDRLQAALGQLAERADEGAGQLIEAVRQAFQEAREGLENIATPVQLHDLVAQFVGPMILRADGTLIPTETAPADAEADVPSNIAGAI